MAKKEYKCKKSAVFMFEQQLKYLPNDMTSEEFYPALPRNYTKALV